MSWPATRRRTVGQADPHYPSNPARPGSTLLTVLLAAADTASPDVSSSDSTKVIAVPGDSSVADGLSRPDSIPIPQPDSIMQALIDSSGKNGNTVRYSGGRVVFFMQRNVIVIQKQASVSSKMQEVDSDSLIAYNRSTGDIYVSGTPKLSDGTEKLQGSRVRYNLDHDHGVISDGSTQLRRTLFTWASGRPRPSRMP